MKLFIDDLREPPDDSWTVVRTGQEAMKLIKEDHRLQDIVTTDDWNLFISQISFDHDLADTNTPEVTGYTVLKFIEELVMTEYYQPPYMTIHSANPVGRTNMQACIDAIERYEDKRLNGN